jgi:methyl-accepting chemotaxis protein
MSLSGTEDDMVEIPRSEYEDLLSRASRAESDIGEASELVESNADVLEGHMETIEQINDEVSNLTATIEEIAATVEEVNEQSNDTADLATEGRESTERAVESMHDIEDASKTVSDEIDQLQARADEIDEIVEVINEIADQTNLLALNASIEAARAGEAGDGFAVVADEVKNLAGESQENAETIESMIVGIQDHTSETVERLDEMNERIESGINDIEVASRNLDDIDESVDEVASSL